MPPSGPTMDPYVVLELERGCSEGDIQKAYKKQCLKWHPDKNRGNEEEANKRFILANEAFKLLFDKTARAEYDRKKEGERVRDEKQRERMQKADGERKRFMEDLERREKEFAERNKRPAGDTSRPKTAAEKKREEERARESFEEVRRRLEREANEEVKEQKAVFDRVREEHAAKAAAAAAVKPQLRVEWKKGDYDEKRLRNIFKHYGKIAAVTGILLKKNGKGKMCVIEFEKGESAWGAELESGEEGDKLKATWLTEPEKIAKEKEVERRVEKEEESNDGGGGGGVATGESTGPDLHELSFEELLAMMESANPPPPKKVKGPTDNPSWKEEI